MQVLPEGGHETAAHVVPAEHIRAVPYVRGDPHAQRTLCAARALPHTALGLAQSSCQVGSPSGATE